MQTRHSVNTEEWYEAYGTSISNVIFKLFFKNFHTDFHRCWTSLHPMDSVYPFVLSMSSSLAVCFVMTDILIRVKWNLNVDLHL